MNAYEWSLEEIKRVVQEIKREVQEVKVKVAGLETTTEAKSCIFKDKILKVKEVIAYLQCLKNRCEPKRIEHINKYIEELKEYLKSFELRSERYGVSLEECREEISKPCEPCKPSDRQLVDVDRDLEKWLDERDWLSERE